MPATERISVEVPSAVAAAMRAQVARGRFGSEGEAVTAALVASAAQEEAIDAWLRGPVAAAYDAVEEGTATLVSIDDVRDRLRGLS